MPLLLVAGRPDADLGRMLVRLNHSPRPDIERYGVAELRNKSNGRSELVLVLDHEVVDRIFMPYDIRSRLGVAKGGTHSFEIRPVRISEG